MSRIRKSVALGAVALMVASGAVALTTPLAASADTGLDGSKVLDLPFDDSIADSGPRGNPTSMIRGAAEYTAGIDGRALKLSGDDALGLGTSPSLQPENLTASFWFKPDGSMGDAEQVFTWNKREWFTDGWYLTSEGPNTPLALSVGPGNNQPYKVAVTGTRDAFFPSDAWTHVVVTYDKTTKAVSFYRNGEKQTSTVVVPVGPNASGVLGTTDVEKTIGFNGVVHNGAYSQGALDDYTLYDAVATTSDVVALQRQNDPTFDPSTIAQKGLDSVSVPTTATADFGVPTSTANGSELSWTSSNADVIAVQAGQAAVVRPQGADSSVTLTASATYGGSTARTKTFTVTVPAEGSTASLYVDDTDLNEVFVADPYLQNSHTKMVDWLLTLDPKRFLYSFDQLSGIPTTAQPYGGWERTTGARFQGHFFGHFLSALSQAYATETDAARKAQLLEKLTTAVDGLKAAQDAYAQNDPDNAGYVSPFPVSYLPGGRDGLIVPFYNLHKVLAGLLKAHQYAPEAVGDEALTVAEKFGTWLNTWGSRQANPGELLNTEYGGMNEALYDLYSISMDENHKKAAQYFDETTLFRQLAAGQDVLAGKHANTTIPKLIGALKRYTVLTDDPTLYARLSDAEKADLGMYRQAADNFWAMVVEDHSYVGGGNSYSEHFQQPGTLYDFATNGNTSGYGENSTVEGCNEYNMLKLTRALFRVAPDVKYADYYENTYINTILASQNPETGMMTYFQPQTAGYAKVFGKKEDEFWCDHGTATESFTKLGDSIYFHKGTSVWVNMFRSSELDSPEQNLKLTQTADVPNTDVVEFSVASLDGTALASGTTLRLRVPDWSPNPTLTVNGNTVDVARENGYLVVPVSAGDKLVYTLPASVTVDSDAGNPNWVAFRYGPIVLSTALSSTNVDASYEAGILVQMSVADKSVSNNVLVSNVDDFKKNIAANLVRLENGLDNNDRSVMRFGLKNVDSAAAALTFEPYYSMYNVRYGLYMNLIEPDSAAAQAMIRKEKEQLRIDETTVDSLVSFDNNNSEAGKSYKTNLSQVGVWRGMGYRDAQANPAAFFQYDLQIDPSAPKNYLGVRYYGGDDGRTFDVYVNDQKLKSERITNAAGADQWYVQYDEIPASFLSDTEAKDRYKKDANGGYVLDAEGKKIPVVTVRFQSNGSSFVGGVYGVFTATQTAFATASALTDLSFDGGTLSPAFDGTTTAYTLSVPKGRTEVTFDADPAVPSGLVFANGILIDDTKVRTVALGEGTPTLALEAYAQDHRTKTTYTVAVVRTDAPSPEPTGTASPEPTETAGPQPTATAGPGPSGTASPTAGGTGSPTAGTATPRTAMSSVNAVERGGVVRVSVSGLAPGEQVTAELRSDPIRITGIPVADANGRVSFDVRIPPSLPTGQHHIVVWAADGSEIARLPVTVSAKGTLAATGAQAPFGVALLGAMLLVAGAAGWAMRRPRTRAS
ncbi:beta-L-arabinofuranosidase domain-containing protein [Microbacterium sp. 20-116]|uniref:beta-L-arabinofuranosidase domain-containing protein n=1 Tax=Microbacterium sp. 20-116 TaxID=3239883 RepID=UPI0034E22BC6